jgi:transposase
MSLIALLKAIEAAHPAKKRIHVYLDNASYHHATIVRDWLKEQHRKSVLHFIPPYCPHLDPIEQCWALMHQNTTHNRDVEALDKAILHGFAPRCNASRYGCYQPM